MTVKKRIKNPFATTSYFRNKKIKELLPYLKEPILDFGAGGGEYTKALRELGYVVDCYEPDNQRHDSDLEYISLELAKTKQYGSVMVLNVLHHVQFPEELLSIIKHLGNTVLVAELNGDSWLVKNYHRIFVREEIGLHYSISTLEQLCKPKKLWTRNFLGFPKVHVYLLLQKRGESD